MYRINNEALSPQQSEIRDLVEHIEELGIFSDPKVESVRYPRDIYRRHLAKEGVRERITRIVHYPEMINPFVDIDGVDSTIVASRYWRNIRALGNQPELPVQVCTGINLFEQLDGNGIVSVDLNPLNLTATGFTRGVSFYLLKLGEQEPLSHEESLAVTSRMLDAITSDTAIIN